MSTDLATMTRALAARARAVARPLARTPAAQRTAAIAAIAAGLERATPAILAANAADLADAAAAELGPVVADRLALDPARLAALTRAVAAVAGQLDPLVASGDEARMPSGLRVARRRLPLGVVLMIYEARPNVTVDAAALCLRSGNAAILRGGSEAARTNAALAAVVTAACAAAGIADAVQRVPTQDRAAIDLLLADADHIDLVVPRGGPGLVQHVVATSRVPVLRHDRGVCHLFVDAGADAEVATRVVLDSKAVRPGVCNALETLLVDRGALAALPAIAAALAAAGVAVRGCAEICARVPWATPASAADWDREFLDLVLAVRVVDGLEAAIAHIDRHGTGHTAAIVTRTAAHAARFAAEVEASCVLVNASTRLNDGGELGLGAELGISTTRLHAFGPMGAVALTVEKFVVSGDGHVRG